MQICTSCKLLLAATVARCPECASALEKIKDIPIGARLGQYELVKKLGEGGMGFVFEALHKVLNRRSALKFLRPEFATNETVVTRFLNEAKAVNLINHENIINVYDYGRTPDQGVYFVMEFLEGETLGDVLKRIGPLPVDIFLPLYIPMVKALAAAHDKQIVHRDLKPANIFLERRDQNPYFVKILDFGVAKLRGDDSAEGLTRAGSLIGTPQYMSPEQISGEAVDHRSDIFAMGVLMYRALAGKAPFQGKSLSELAQQVILYDPKPLREISAELPPKLEEIVQKCLAKSPENRYQSMRDLLADLNALREEEEISENAVPDIPPPADAPPRPPSRSMTSPGTGTLSSSASLPMFQGVPVDSVGNALVDAPNVNDIVNAAVTATPTPTSKPLPKWALAVAPLAVVVGVGAVFLLKKPAVTEVGKPASTAGAEVAAPVQKQAKPMAELWAAGDKAGAKEEAKKLLEAAISSGEQLQQDTVVKALTAVRSPMVATQLFDLLKGNAGIRGAAARALKDLKLPDAAPKIRDALAGANPRDKVELAGVLLYLGDKDGMPILLKGLDDTGTRKAAALALAQMKGKEALPVLQELFESAVRGRESWFELAEGLSWLGDEAAKKALSEELSQKDAKRAVFAAAILARQGDETALGMLSRASVDASFGRRSTAAYTLALLGKKEALAYVKEGITSPDAEIQRDAIGIAAILAKDGGDASAAEIAALADKSSDLLTKLTAAAALLVL